MALASRIALVTGAASGLGRATAVRFVKQGARVVLCDLEGSEGPLIAQELEGVSSSSSPAALFCPTDVTQPDQVAAALDSCEEIFGRPLDTVVNCAGIGLARATLSVKTNGDNDDERTWRVHDPDSFHKILRVNVEGTFNVVRLAAERMAKAKANNQIDDDDGIPDGVIVNTASIAAYDGQIGQVAYSASKGAIVSMTLPLARDLARYHIRANAIAPGLFRTPLLEGLPQQVQEELGANVPCPSRLGDPDEFAHLVQSVVENPMINGEVIRIDGALRMPPK